MSRQNSQQLLEVAEKVGFHQFPLEDVLFTGVYREMANITKLTKLPNICEHFRFTFCLFRLLLAEIFQHEQGVAFDPKTLKH